MLLVLLVFTSSENKVLENETFCSVFSVVSKMHKHISIWIFHDVTDVILISQVTCLNSIVIVVVNQHCYNVKNLHFKLFFKHYPVPTASLMIAAHELPKTSVQKCFCVEEICCSLLQSSLKSSTKFGSVDATY